MKEVEKIEKKIHEIAQSSKFAHEAVFFARVIIGCTFIYHAFQKFDAGGVSFFMTLVGIVELVSAIFIILGSRIRTASSVLSVVLLGAIFTKIFVWNNSFSGNGGWEFDIVILALLFMLASVDSTKYKIIKKK